MQSAKISCVLVGACLLTLSSHSALAQFGGYYVELSGGPAETTVDPIPPLSEGTVTTEMDAESTMYAFTTGFRFSDYISAEASYVDYGSFSGSASATDVVFFQSVDPVTQEPVILQANALVEAETEYEAKAFTASVIGSWPVTRRFSVYAELGLAAWDVESDLAGTLTYTGEVQDSRRFTADFSDGGSSFFYSAGIHYRFNLSYGIKLEYQENKFESDIFSSDAEVRSVNLGLRLYY